MEYYSTIKKSKFRTFGGKWVRQENMLSEIGQMHKLKYHMVFLI